MKLPRWTTGGYSRSIQTTGIRPEYRIADLLRSSTRSIDLYDVIQLPVFWKPDHYLPKAQIGSFGAQVHNVVGLSNRMTEPDLLKLLIGAASNNLETEKTMSLVMELVEDKHYEKLLMSLLNQKLDTVRAFAEKLLVPSARQGKWNLVKTLIESGVDIDAKLGGRVYATRSATALESAVDAGNVDMVRYLIERGATDLSAIVENPFYQYSKIPGCTMVDLAVHRGHHSLVMYLLQNASPTTKRVPNVTIYHLRNAILLGHVEMVRSLLDSSSSIREAARAYPWLFYEAAALCKNEDDAGSMINMLLSYDFAITSTDAFKRGSTLTAAAVVPHMALIKRLLAAGFGVNSVASGHTSRPKDLSDGHDTYKSVLGTITGKSALHVAASQGHEGLVQLLISNGADASQDCGSYPIQGAAWNGRTTAVALLLQAGANVNARKYPSDSIEYFPHSEKREIWPAILLALLGNHIETAEILHSGGAFLADYIEDDFSGIEFLPWLLENGSQALLLSVMDQLLGFQKLESFDVDILTDRFGEEFIAELARTGVQVRRIPNIYALIDDHSDWTQNREGSRDSRQEWPSFNQFLPLKILEGSEESPEQQVLQNIAQQDGLLLRHGPRLLALAIEGGLERMVLLLLHAGLSPFEPIAEAKDEMMKYIDYVYDFLPGRSAFFIAVEESDERLTGFFLDWNSAALDDNQSLSRHQQMCRAYCLTLHIDYGDTWLRDLLAKYGIDHVVAIQTLGASYIKKYLYSYLNKSIQERSYDTTDRILRQQERFGDLANPPELGLGSTLLQLLVQKNEVQQVRSLLDLGADVNAEADDLRGATALQFAAINGNFEIAHILLEAGADVNAPRAAYDGRTAIEGAAEWGRLDMVHHLLEVGADIEFCTNYRRTVYRAWKNGHRTIARMVHNWKREKCGEQNCEAPETVLKSMTRLELYGELPAMSNINEGLDKTDEIFPFNSMPEYTRLRSDRKERRRNIEREIALNQAKPLD
jgi:ankyrin repeat protein